MPAAGKRSSHLKRELRQARRAVDSATRKRDRVIRKAVMAGMPLRDIARTVGLSHEKVRQVGREL
jgi:transposase-like protein